MSLLYIVLPSALILTIAYFVYGRVLARLFQLNADRKTPAIEMQDGVDYAPLQASSLFPQHFSAIAAAGPIVGPILAGMVFGWLPALIWILVGSILIGGVHDFSSLVASIRHKARSIAEVVRDHMSQRSYMLFLAFIWIALVYIIVAFTDITAAAFIGAPSDETGNVGGGAIATSSALYLLLTLAMGLCIKYLKMPLGWATLLFVTLVGGAIVAGPYIPLDVASIFQLSEARSRKVWDVVLLLYCLAAGIVPVWLLLQPRGHLGGYFLYFALGAGAVGLIFGGDVIQYPAFRGWEVSTKAGTQSLFPMLFIMIACGACSGFHSLIASGTTSKQLKKETDAKAVGYGSMLLEAMVAIVSLCCVMMFAFGDVRLNPDKPNLVYAQGIGRFLESAHIPAGIISQDAIGIPMAIGISFALMAFTTFVYDTLDVCTRLGRYVLQELTGQQNRFGRFFGTALTAGVPLYFLLMAPETVVDKSGAVVAAPPIWRTFWNLFGASNQLLAALTLLGITVWLWKTRRVWWVWIVTGIPTVWMYAMSTWALASITYPKFVKDGNFVFPLDAVAWAGVVLIALAALMLIEAIRIIAGLGSPPQPAPEVAPSGVAPAGAAS